MTTIPNRCSCGTHDAHPVARRVTSDGIAVWMWSDGAVTSRAGVSIVVRRPQSGAYAVAQAIEANRILADDVCLYTWAELPNAIRRARRALESPRVPTAGYVRAEVVA